MEGHIVGVFGTDKELKARFEASVAKKSEVEGMIVYHRSEAGTRVSLLDDPQFPERVQGYARIASVCDYAYYLYPPDGRLAAPDGELAVLLESFKLPGSVELLNGPGIASSAGPSDVRSSFKGLRLASDFPIETRSAESSVLDLSDLRARSPTRPPGLLVYIDRAFSVKGVGTVVLGFILSGKVSVHDKLRCIPSSSPSTEKTVEVKGIQVNDEDQETAGRGVRVGLSLKNVDSKELDKTSWLDDGSFALTQKLRFSFEPSGFYKQSIEGRDLHVQLPGEAVLASVSRDGADYVASLPFLVPHWDGMRVAVLDLNGKNLRVAGGGSSLPSA